MAIWFEQLRWDHAKDDYTVGENFSSGRTRGDQLIRVEVTFVMTPDEQWRFEAFMRDQYRGASAERRPSRTLEDGTPKLPQGPIEGEFIDEPDVTAKNRRLAR